MGPVKNPPSPQPNLRKDHSSTVSEDMAPAAKSRRLLNSCLTENQKVCLNEIESQMNNMDEKKIEETNKTSLDIPYLSENNENAVSAAKKPASLSTIPNSTNPAVTMPSVELLKVSSDVTKLPDLSIFETTLGSNGEKMENRTVHVKSEDQASIENHNSNTSSAPEDLNSPLEVREKVPSLSDWTKDRINNSQELSSLVQDTLSEMVSDSHRLCEDTTRLFANTYFSQTSSNVDKLIEQLSSQGGQSFNQPASVRRQSSAVERDHKFYDSHLKPLLNFLKAEFEVLSDDTEESSDEEMTFPSGAGNMASGNESSPLPQSPASTMSDFSTFSTSADLPQLPSQAHVVVEKTSPAERNYLRRRADIHSVWVWLAVKYKSQKRQLKKLNQIYLNCQRTALIQPSQANTRRHEQLTRSSSPESTPSFFTGPPTPVSSSEASAADGEACSSASGVNGTDDASTTSARVRPYIWERATSGSSPTHPKIARPSFRPCQLTGCIDLLEAVYGTSSVQCHCHYPEVYPCVLCCGKYVDRELNPSAAAKSTRMQLPPPEKLYPRHKLDLSYHEKLSRSSDSCHSLSYDESFVSRRPRLVFFTHAQSQQQSPPSFSSQHRQQSLHSEQPTPPLPVKHQHEQQQQPKHPQQHSQLQHQRQHSPHQRSEADESPSGCQTKHNTKRLEHFLSNGDHPDGSQTTEDLHRHASGSSRIVTNSSFMRRKRGRRKQHPYIRSSAQHPSSSYYTTGEELDYNDAPNNEDDNHRQPANFCKQRLAHQIQQHSRSRSLYRPPNQQWHHQRHHQVPHQQQHEQQSQYRHRHHQPQHHYHQQQSQQLQRQTTVQSRRGLQSVVPQVTTNRLSQLHRQQQQSQQQEREEEELHRPQESCRGQYHQQKLSGNRQHCQKNQQHAQRSKVRSNLDLPMSTESSVSSPSSHSSSVQVRSDANHSHPGMRSLVVNMASSTNSSDIIVSKDHSHPSNDSQCVLVRRQSACTTIPIAARRTVPVSKMGFLSRGSSIPDEDTASVSSSGGSVKSMRSVCSSRLEVRRRSEESSVGLRSLSVVSESLRQSENRPQTDIETPLWRRLPAGIPAAPEESAVMHLLSVGAVGSVRDRDVSDATRDNFFHSNDLKNVKNTSDLTTPYHLVMLDENQSVKGIEDTSDVVYVQRHKAGEVTERSSAIPSDSGSNNRSNTMEELCLQPGELLDQVRR